LGQSFNDFELIVVNDGSTDDSLEILSKYAHDKRITILNQENRGVSSARNAGIEAAKSDWITFVDIDDYINPGYIGNFFSSPVDADVLRMQGCTIVYSDGHRDECKFTHGCYDIMNGIVKGRLLHNGYSIGKLYNRNLILENRLRFDTTISYKEDLLFLLNYLSYCKCIDFLPYIDYIYCRRSGGLSWRYRNPEFLIELNTKLKETAMDLGPSPRNITQYLNEYDKFCVAETLDSIYSEGRFKRLTRYNLVNKLRNIGGGIFIRLNIKRTSYLDGSGIYA